MSGPSKSSPKSPSPHSRERAYSDLRQQIAGGALGTGTGISESPIAKKLGIRRGPLRGALVQLTIEGILEQILNGGAAVAGLSREHIVGLYEAGEALERYANEKIARAAMSPADKDRLQDLIDQIGSLEEELIQRGEESLDSRQMERFVQFDIEFHCTLKGIARNSLFRKAVAETRFLIRIFAMRCSGHNCPSLADSREYRQEILDAVMRQECDSVQRYLTEHIGAIHVQRSSQYDASRREAVLLSNSSPFRRPSVDYSKITYEVYP